jgi:peptidoglycan/LPS O-acetylase OafA/YrhL
MVRRNNFDFLRWVLAALVIFSHSFPLSIGEGAWDPLQRLTGDQMTFGRLAVGGFFALSGYLILQSRKNSDGFWHFMWKRLLRIAPAFTLCFVVTALVLGYLGAAKPESYFSELRLRGLYIQARNLALLGAPSIPPVFAHVPFPGALNGSLWTIPYEEGCYIMVGALWLVGLYRNRWAVLALFVATLIWYTGSGSNTSRLLAWFLAGSTLYHFRPPYQRRWLIVSLAALIVASAVRLLGPALTIFGTYLAFYFAFLPSARFRNFARFGDWSYGTYLYAWPVQQLVVQTLPGIRPLPLFVTATVVTTIFAAGSWHLVEKRALALKGAWLEWKARPLSDCGRMDKLTLKT